MVFDSAPLENVADVLQNLSQVVLCVFSSLLILSQGTQDAVKRKVRRFRTAAVAVSCPRSCLREEEEKMQVELQKQRLDQTLEAKQYLGRAWHCKKGEGNSAKLRPDS